MWILNCQVGMRCVRKAALVLIYLLLFRVEWVHAAKMPNDWAVYPAQKVAADGIKEILIRGVAGRVGVFHSLAPYFTVQVRHRKGQASQDWNLMVDRQRDQLLVEIFSVRTKEKVAPQFDVILKGPSQPLILGWRSGDIAVHDWHSSMSISSGFGSVQIAGCDGDLHLQLQSGQVQVHHAKGNVQLRVADAKVNVADVGGRVILNMAQGQAEFRDLRGGGELSLGRAELKASGMSGDWRLVSEESGVRLLGLSGSLWGELEKGDLWVEGAPLTYLRVKSQMAPVTLKISANLLSDSNVVLASEKGRISAPAHFHSRFENGMRFRESRAQRSPPNRLWVQTERAPIVLGTVTSKALTLE